MGTRAEEYCANGNEAYDDSAAHFKDFHPLRTCLQSVALLQQSMAFWCSDTGTTGSASAPRNRRRPAATEFTVPGILGPPVSRWSRMSSSSP